MVLVGGAREVLFKMDYHFENAQIRIFQQRGEMCVGGQSGSLQEWIGSRP